MKDLLSLLNEYVPTEEEVGDREKMLAFVKGYADCFERFLEVGHVTASAWLLDKTGEKALLMHHTKLDQWVQLGGHCDGNPDVLSAAIKEAQEESGVMGIVPVNSSIFDLDIHEIPEKGGVKAHLHYDIRFLLQIISDEEIKKNHESKELLWIGKREKELPTKSRSVVRMFHKWVHAKG